MLSDLELLSFAAQVVEKFGGAVERQEDRLMAVLPDNLARDLELPETVEFGGDAIPLLYGSPILDRMIHVTTGAIPVLFGRLAVPYLKKSGFDQALNQDLLFSNAQVRISTGAEARTTYMVVICRYLALSDERKEGLVEVGVHENSGAIVEGFEKLWPQHQPEFFAQESLPPHFPAHVEQAVRNAMHTAQGRAAAQLADFTDSMKRRLHRDVRNTREYYDALRQEMEASLVNPHLGETQQQERRAKIQELPPELDRKIADLSQKYRIQITLSGCAVLRLLVDVVKIMTDIRFKKFSRTLNLIWNPLLKRFDPLVCELCQTTIRAIYFRPEDAEMKPVCLSCAQKK